jgi:hypothetical protein
MTDDTHYLLHAGLFTCPECGHPQPAIYFSSRGPCFDCTFGFDRPAGPAENEMEREYPPTGSDGSAEAGLPPRSVIASLAESNASSFAVAVASLTPTQATAFNGYAAGKSLGQIARENGTGTPAVSKALARALQHFRAVGLLNQVAA